MNVEEEPGKCTQHIRRGMGSGISGKIRRDNVGIAFGKLGRGGAEVELAKPLNVIQRVQVPPDQSRADRSVVSLAIHQATGGCRSVGNKEAGREDSAPKSYLVARPTCFPKRKAVSGSDRHCEVGPTRRGL
jgi:hypothetical protein